MYFDCGRPIANSDVQDTQLTCISIYFSVCTSIHPNIYITYISINLSIWLSIHIYNEMSVYISKYRAIFLSRCLYVDCGRIPAVSGGQVTYLNKSTHLESMAELTCQSSYRIHGNQLNHLFHFVMKLFIVLIKKCRHKI